LRRGGGLAALCPTYTPDRGEKKDSVPPLFARTGEKGGQPFNSRRGKKNRRGGLDFRADRRKKEGAEIGCNPEKRERGWRQSGCLVSSLAVRREGGGVSVESKMRTLPRPIICQKEKSSFLFVPEPLGGKKKKERKETSRSSSLFFIRQGRGKKDIFLSYAGREKEERLRIEISHITSVHNGEERRALDLKEKKGGKRSSLI